jgi:hypothetical protein
MNQADVEQFVTGLPNVQQTENYGYQFYFVGDDHRLPFVTIANTDTEYDNVSHLDRDGVFRTNIGVSKETFTSLTSHFEEDDIDYTALNTFLPHPDYAAQSWVCILNPEGDNVEQTKRLIEEAHAIATTRYERLQRKAER